LNIHRQYFNNLRTPYTKISDIKSIITQLSHQVNDVVRFMAAYDLIDVERIKNGIILKRNEKILMEVFKKIEDYDNDLLDFLVNILASIHLNGKDGLKSRTGLFEYRYDNA
jgi:N-methylhydantoinase B/oxoprolinase/acetone carboxylase alpha subunit